jgi:hypothetical protein
MSAYIGPMNNVFRFRFDPLARPVLTVLGVFSGNTSVTLTDNDRFVAKFGRWVVDTPISNIDCVKATGPYRRYKAIGVRGSMVDHGITFGTTAAGGVCVTFIESIPRLIPGMKSHPGLTVTVADIAGLVAALESRR